MPFHKGIFSTVAGLFPSRRYSKSASPKRKHRERAAELYCLELRSPRISRVHAPQGDLLGLPAWQGVVVGFFPETRPRAGVIHGGRSEKNWGDRGKLAIESNVTRNQAGNGPGVNVLVEVNYLLTRHFSLHDVGYYANSMLQGGISYQVPSASGGVSYRL
jgi:hypothetical protein